MQEQSTVWLIMKCALFIATRFHIDMESKKTRLTNNKEHWNQNAETGADKQDIYNFNLILAPM